MAFLSVSRNQASTLVQTLPVDLDIERPPLLPRLEHEIALATSAALDEFFIISAMVDPAYYERFQKLFEERRAPDFSKVMFHPPSHTVKFGYAKRCVIWELQAMGFYLFRGKIIDRFENLNPFAFVLHSTNSLTTQNFYKKAKRYFCNYEYIKYNSLRETFFQRNRHFFKKPPHLESFLNSINHHNIVEQILFHFPGFCLSDFHSSEAPKEFLIKNMPLLAQYGVTTLFMEGISKRWANRINKETPLSRLSLSLLEAVDISCKLQYTFNNITGVVLAAKKAGIHIAGIETERTPILDADNSMKLSDNLRRVEAMNYIALKTIFKHSEKWVVFAGQGHAMRFGSIPGLDELLGCPSVGIGPEASSKRAMRFPECTIDIESPIIVLPAMPRETKSRAITYDSIADVLLAPIGRIITDPKASGRSHDTIISRLAKRAAKDFLSNMLLWMVFSGLIHTEQFVYILVISKLLECPR